MTEGSGTTDTSSGTTDATGTTTGTETTDSSTGEPVAVCGNGVLEAFGPVPEECDDGNLDPEDGCSDTCALDRRVFVTSVDYQAGELQSLKLADALCGNLADDQGWPDALKYRAWLSDSTTDARDRFKQGRGRLVMVNGLVLAASWSALLAGELENPLEVTEKSETYHGGVWTGTRPDGTAVPGAEHCDDWSTSSFLKTGHYGYSDRTTPEWTLSALDDNPSGCPIAYALYCMQSL
jgi:cysteine-rich repeat protein